VRFCSSLLADLLQIAFVSFGTHSEWRMNRGPGARNMLYFSGIKGLRRPAHEGISFAIWETANEFAL
jgi:hypothetical protein